MAMRIGREELLQSILESPEDDERRLVFADWLEDQGDVDRANLVRFQCEAARLEPWDRRWQEATWQATALLERHARRWRHAELPALPGVEWTDFERGLVVGARVRDPATLYAQEDALRAATPISCVEIASLEESAAPRPAGSVQWLRKLRVRGSEHTVSESASLLSAAETIEVVDLGDGEDLAWLLDWLDRRAAEEPGSKDVGPLAELKVEGSHTVGLNFVRELVEASEASATHRGPTLLRLDLATTFIDWDSGYFEDPTIGPLGARMLAEAHSMRRVEVLSVDRQRVGVEGLTALVNSFRGLHELRARSVGCDNLAQLELDRGAPFDRIDLSGNTLGTEGVRILASAQRLATLKWLDLDTCEIKPEGVSILAEAPFWQTLGRLELSRNPLGREGARALAEHARPSSLHTLGLADVDFDGDAAVALARVPWLRDLTSLDLSRNAIDRFAPLMSLVDGALKKLSLARTKLSEDDARVLAPLFRRLWHLDLSDNPLGDAGLAHILAREGGELFSLHLRRCELTARAIRDVLSRASLPHLHDLSLQGNALDAKAVEAVLSSSSIGPLRTLDLRQCRLSDDVAHMLAKAPRASELNSLDLRGNEISIDAIVAIARAKSLRSVKKIRLTTDNIWSVAQATRAELDERFGYGWAWDRDDEDEEGDQNEDE